MKKALFLKNSQKGSTFITVIVAVSFMTILASIMMTISLANLRMKQVEYRAKKNFYGDEQGLEDIYNGIGRDVTILLSKAYQETLSKTIENSTGAYTNQRDAYNEFAKLFQDGLTALYGENDKWEESTLKMLNQYVTRSEENVKDQQEKSIVTVNSYDKTIVEASGGVFSRYLFKDVVVTYTDKDRNKNETGYEAVITTDIVIEVPYIQFFQNFSRVLDYSLIGNKGVYFSGSNRLVQGNIYAGTDKKETNAAYQGYQYEVNTAYDGMNFYQSAVTFQDNQYITSKGDFNICESVVKLQPSDGSKPTSMNLWVENIRTVEKGRAGAPIIKETISEDYVFDAYANLYVANDLEINARNSKVSLSGNYYGYNTNGRIKDAYDTAEKDNIGDRYEASAQGQAFHTTSSAILINANDSELNLKKLDTLVIAGLAYVDIKNPALPYAGLSEKAKEYQTGESVALRYNQFLYLAPAEILHVSNPEKDGSVDVSQVCVGEIDLESWFGKELIDENQPVIPVVYNMNGVNYTYYFLKFKGNDSKVKYLDEVMKAVDPGETGDSREKQKWKIKQEIMHKADYAGIKSQIQIDGTTCKIYTNGIVTDTESNTTYSNTMSMPNVYGNSLNMAKHYEYLYKRLDPAEQFSDLSESLDTSVIDAESTALGLSEEDLPAGYFVDFGKIAEDIVKQVNGYDVIICANKKSIDRDVRGIVLARGDITIEDGVSVNGMVISNGKIIVKGTGSIQSNQGIIQSILEKEQREIGAVEEIDKPLLRKYASYYLKQNIASENKKNNDSLIDIGSHSYIDNTKRITSTEYTDFIYYENWHKGQD